LPSSRRYPVADRKPFFASQGGYTNIRQSMADFVKIERLGYLSQVSRKPLNVQLGLSTTSLSA
jgi:hypothetical protein